MTVEAPLSFGQLYSWREVDSYPLEGRAEANLPACWDLRGLSLERVKRALRQLFDWYEPLRTSYHLREGKPVQHVHPDTSPPISHVDRVITDFGDPDRTTGQLLAQPFAMTEELCWRGVLVTTGGAPMFLAMAFSHLIVDVWSIHELERQFRALLDDPDTAYLHAQLGASPTELAARQQRDESALSRQQGAERHWRKVLTDELVYRPPTLPLGVQRNRIQATLHSHRLTELTAEAAKLHGVTAPAVVAALVTVGLSRHTAAARIPLSLMSSNRFSPEAQRTVGTLNQLIPVPTTVDPGATVAAHITGLHWAAAKAYRHSCYNLDRVAELAAEIGPPAGHDNWFNELFPCWFNYLPLDGQAPDRRDRTHAELAWTPQARQFGQPFDVRVTVRGGRTSVALRVDPELIGAEALTDVLRIVALGTHRAVTEPHRPVRDLWAAADLPRQLFPPAPSLALAAA